MLGDHRLIEHYHANFILMHHHKYSLETLNDMMPFEREIYMLLLQKHLQQEKERLKQRSGETV